MQQTDLNGSFVRKNTLKKSLKISDDGFLKSARDHFKLKKIAFADELRFFIEDGGTRMRLGDVRENLGAKGVFLLPEDDVERICQIASDKCVSQEPNDNAIETWIDIEKFINMIITA